MDAIRPASSCARPYWVPGVQTTYPCHQESRVTCIVLRTTVLGPRRPNNVPLSPRISRYLHRLAHDRIGSQTSKQRTLVTKNLALPASSCARPYWVPDVQTTYPCHQESR